MAGQLLLSDSEINVNEAYGKCVQQTTKLKSYLQQKAATDSDNTLTTVSENSQLLNLQLPSLRCSNKLRGHRGKVYALCWSPIENSILSAAQDGQLILFDADKSRSIFAIPLRNAWVMTCAISTSGKYCASGGLDNLVTTHNIENTIGYSYFNDGSFTQYQEHEGYISCIKFIDDNRMLSGSGDGTVKLWDINKQKCVTTFAAGNGCDVEAIDINLERSLFLSGSIDAMTRLYDYRTQMSTKHIAEFKGHTTDINAVKWFHDNISFVTGSDDTTVRLWDIRSFKTLNVYSDANMVASVTSIDSSHSGTYIFVGYDDDRHCVVWNTLDASVQQTLDHPTRVSCLELSPEGDLLATGCWDKLVRTWTAKPRSATGFGIGTCACYCLMCMMCCSYLCKCKCCKCDC